jgi:hypothetical protein
MADAKKNPMTRDEFLAEERRLARFGASQAKRLRIGEDDIVRIIHEFRARRTSASRRTRQ